MTYIGCMNQLWRSAMMSPMPASEIALFAYLVNESNKRYWKMRLCVPLQGYAMICAFQDKQSLQHGNTLPSVSLSLLLRGNHAMYRPNTQCLNGRMI